MQERKQFNISEYMYEHMQNGRPLTTLSLTRAARRNRFQTSTDAGYLFIMRDATRLATAALCVLSRAAESHDSHFMVAEALERIDAHVTCIDST